MAASSTVRVSGPGWSNIHESGRNRPERFRRDTGYSEFERTMAQRRTDPHWMDPLECGRRVVEAVRRNELFILTHPEFRDGAQERFDALLASFPDEPVDPERAEAIAFLLRNPIYAEILERRR